MIELSRITLQLAVWIALGVAVFWLVGIYTKAWCDRARKVALMNLHRELGQLRWIGADEGWECAITAVRNRLTELVRDGYKLEKKP